MNNFRTQLYKDILQVRKKDLLLYLAYCLTPFWLFSFAYLYNTPLNYVHGVYPIAECTLTGVHILISLCALCFLLPLYLLTSPSKILKTVAIGSILINLITWQYFCLPFETGMKNSIYQAAIKATLL